MQQANIAICLYTIKGASTETTPNNQMQYEMSVKSNKMFWR